MCSDLTNVGLSPRCHDSMRSLLSEGIARLNPRGGGTGELRDFGLSRAPVGPGRGRLLRCENSQLRILKINSDCRLISSLPPCCCDHEQKIIHAHAAHAQCDIELNKQARHGYFRRAAIH